MSDNALTPIDKFRQELNSRADVILAAAPSHINRERFNEIAARCVIGNPDLLQCTPRSLFTAIAEAAAIGLMLDGVLGHAYLIPFKEKGGWLRATLVPGYKGLRELAYRSEKIAAFHWGVVRPGDQFEFSYGTQQALVHKPSDELSSEWTHVWAMAETVYGGKMFQVMTRALVEAHRDRFSKGWRRAGSAWQTNPEAMALKTVALKVMRLCPLSPEVQTLVERATYEPSPQDDLPDGAETPAEDLDDVIDGLDPASAPCDAEGKVIGVPAEQTKTAMAAAPQGEIPF